MPKFNHSLTIIPGRVYLIVAVIIFAAASSVTRLLTELGAKSPIDGRNPFSFCNVLVAGNLIALIAFLILFGQEVTKLKLRKISLKTWLFLSIVSILGGALSPALFFQALTLTPVNNVILIGRLEPVLVLALSFIFLKERVNSWVIAGAISSFIGVIITIFWQPPGDKMVSMAFFEIGQGELISALAAVAAAVANIISQVTLKQVTLGLFNIIKTVISTIIFSVVVLQIYGAKHFLDLFTPVLWQWMLLYSIVIVVGGQLCWFAGLRKTSAAEVSLASSFNPIAGIIAAYLILGEAPTKAHYLGGLIILMGIILSQVGITQKMKQAGVRDLSRTTNKTPITSANQEIEKETEMGFRGI